MAKDSEKRGMTSEKGYGNNERKRHENQLANSKEDNMRNTACYIYKKS